MTPAERENPKIINGSRRLRIANGSGVKVNDVNQLVDRFFEARKMMGQMGGMGLPGMRKRSATKSSKNKRKGEQGQEGRPRPDAAAHARRLPGRVPGRHASAAARSVPPGDGPGQPARPDASSSSPSSRRSCADAPLLGRGSAQDR